MFVFLVSKIISLFSQTCSPQLLTGNIIHWENKPARYKLPYFSTINYQTYPPPFLSVLCLPSASRNERPTLTLELEVLPPLILNFLLSLAWVFPSLLDIFFIPWATAALFLKKPFLILHTTLAPGTFLFSPVTGKKKRVVNCVDAAERSRIHREGTYSSLSPTSRSIFCPITPLKLLLSGSPGIPSATNLWALNLLAEFNTIEFFLLLEYWFSQKQSLRQRFLRRSFI